MLAEETRPNCTTCGLPLAEATCRACGGSGSPIFLADGVASSASAYAPDPGRPELELAYDAWKSGDHGRLISHCLAAEGISDAKMQQAAEGPVFKAMVRGMSTFIRVLGPSGDVIIEVPAVRLPLTQYVPSLRLVLELSDRDATPTRFSVRGDLVMTRFFGRLATLTPSALCAAIDAVVGAASDCARLLVGALQARELTADEHRALAIEALPRGLVLVDELPTSSAQALKKSAGGGMFDALEPLVEQAPRYEPPNRPTPVAEIPAVLMPPGGMPAQGAPRAKAPTPARLVRPTTGHESRLAPTGAPPGPKPSSLRPPPPADTVQSASPSISPGRGLQPPPKPGVTQPPPQGSIGRTMVSSDGTPHTTPSATPPPDPLGDTFIGNGQPGKGPVKTGSPADGLCELMHRAQTLGAVLSFADQPATMCLLIRAAVYRAIHEHESVVPNAVAFLFHATLPMTREIFITAPGMRRGSMAIPATSPAFEVMARIVSQRAEVERGEPLQVQPITTAQEAKQHLARYVSEIDQAPSDAELRHFLALGALSELLVRTKLPAATQERLKGILSHARKEGAKPNVVELMMTALTRMIA